MYSPYACHDKGSIYESLSFQNHRHLISSKCVDGLGQMKLTSFDKNCHILRRSLTQTLFFTFNYLELNKLKIFKWKLIHFILPCKENYKYFYFDCKYNKKYWQ
jgi:hypothetical protein